MPLWRRRSRPLHEQLAAGTGLLRWDSKYDAIFPAFGGTLDVLHGGRPRRWDAVVTVEADVKGDAVRFVALPDGTLLIEDGVEDADAAPLAEAIEAELSPPYRAQAGRHEGVVWGVAAARIEVMEFAGLAGDRITVSAHDGHRRSAVDGEAAWDAPPQLVARGESEGADYVVDAERLDGDLWEVRAHPL